MMLPPDRRTTIVALLGIVLIRAPGIEAGNPDSPDARLKMLISRPLEGGELLYNGIRLPKVWPPDYLCPQSVEPMPVPYLVHRPDVVPIDVGRQLFVDDFLIDETDLRRTYHAARRYAHNPVLRAETDESLRRRGTVYLGHGGVFFDPADKLFKMFYVDGWRGPLAMAASPDMVHWNRPELAPGRGNILLPRSVDDNSIWLDLNAASPDERLKYLECHRGSHPNRGHFLYTSADGLTWSEGVKLVFPYTGFSGIAPDGSRGMYHGASIGLAFLRRDGFASMDAGPGGGTLATRPVRFSGTRLFVNAKVPDGTLRAEVLDEAGQPIAPFTLANSIPFTGDSTLQPMAWNGAPDLSPLRGKPVRFRFELAGGSLYAFWVSRDDTGRSDGYLGAGGPGYDDVVDTVGRAALEAVRSETILVPSPAAPGRAH